MKRIALLAAAMIISAGMAFAQQPVKKANDNKAQTVKLEPGATQATPQKQGCGNCPKHSQCTKGNNAQSAQTDNATAKPACGKSCNKGAATENKGKATPKSTNASVTK